jgi:CheY-like chemotaxis protein
MHGKKEEMTQRLVIADDDAIQRKLVATRLRAAGYEVDPVGDGAEVLARIREVAPFAVVSDVLMPNLDGFELCKAVRADPALRHIPVLLVTNSYVEHGDRDLAKLSGARDLILRTPDLADVLTALAALKPG